MGVIRFVTSMAAVDRQLFLSIGVCTLIGIAILTMVYFSNLYFVRSIVEPLASINETARLIADGSYGIQIEKKFDDEIGELTDTINDMSLKIKQSEKDPIGVYFFRLPRAAHPLSPPSPAGRRRFRAVS